MKFESIIGRVPDKWRLVTLGQLCESGGGNVSVGTSEIPTDDPNGIPCITPENIHDNRLSFEHLCRLPSLSDRKTTHARVHAGDLLLSRRGDLSRMALVDKDEDGWRCSSGCLIVRFGNAPVNPRFAYYYLNHPSVRTWLSRHAVGAAMPHLNKSIALSLPFVLPPLRTQDEIAGILDALDQKLLLNKKINRTLAESAGAMFEMLLESRASTSGWQDSTLQACCVRMENGRTPARGDESLWNPGTIPWLTSGEIKQGVITSTQTCISEKGMAEARLKLWPAGTTVVALCGVPAGQAALLSKEACANQACCGLIAPEALQNFVYLYISASEAELKRLTHGSAQQNLNQQTLARFPIQIPDEAALRKFNDAVNPLLQKIAANNRVTSALLELREELIPRLMSGHTKSDKPVRRVKPDVRVAAAAAV